MDEEPRTDSESACDSTFERCAPAVYSSGMFSGSQNLTVATQTLTNITNHYNCSPTVFPDFRQIPIGDIYLVEEIKLELLPRTVRRPHERGSVRRVYSARVAPDGLQSNMTVAMYQGEGAEEEWRREIARYSCVRHPNFVQLFGITTSANIYAAIFYGDLIPFQHFLNLHQHSHFSTIYIYAYRVAQFMEAQTYFHSAFQQHLLKSECTFWVHRVTGRLCAELVPSESHWKADPDELSNLAPLHAPGQETQIIASLTVEQYHDICYWDLSHFQKSPKSRSATVNVGAVYSSSDHFNPVAWLDIETDGMDWYGANGKKTDNGWTRFNSNDLPGQTVELRVWHQGPWLSQANQILTRLQITSHLEDYLLACHVCFKMEISAIVADPPAGFLFLCPAKDLQIAPSSFRWPDCSAYWSFDPLGVKRLSTEEATAVGFPSIELYMEILERSWDTGVYAGLRQFHKAKGFNPDSQDLARHLGDPLYRLSTEMDPPFAHSQ
ncbi:hypothetical protein B0H19DRAFT_1276637 [Mycena capillaripes]|nr:hypothetical protein B0H19DRAFT_1276637 [Mycena capillaripes]